MKILLIGEFSGFYNALAEGLEFHGHEVFLANTGDGIRNFHSDYNWKKNRRGYVGKTLGVFDLWNHKKKFKGYDIVQLISPYFIPTIFLNKIFIQYVINNNSKVFWTACGTSNLISKYWIESKNLKCGVYDFHEKQAHNKGKKMMCEKPEYIDYENWLIENIQGIIPTIFEYSQPFRNHKKNLGTIPFPINTDKIIYRENNIINKIIFYHGITRPEKGTIYIKDAFDMIRKKYKDEAEFICNKQLPYEQYIKIINSTNIILDQTNSFSTAMNGLISMAKGKVLMGGAEPEGINELGYNFCPIINITSNPKQICEAIDWIMDHRNKISEIGANSRKFIETYHDYKKIAAEYLNKWK